MSLFRTSIVPRISSLILRRSLATVAEPTPESVASTSTSSTQKWTPFTSRVGAIARKRGMTALWDENGRRWPVTVLQLEDCQVIRHQTPPASAPHLHSLQIGTSNRPHHTVTHQMLGHFKKAGVEPKYKVEEFRVTDDAVLPVGTTITAGHFVPGQLVDVTAKTIGKGFQGAMKRHGFRGQSASHGTTKTHRSLGSTGQNTTPSRVLPGKKMAGQMGGRQRTTQNLMVHRVDTVLNLIYVRGGVPGFDDAFISIRDAVRGVKWRANAAFLKGKDQDVWLKEGVKDLPMPTVTPERLEREGWPAVIEWPGTGRA